MELGQLFAKQRQKKKDLVNILGKSTAAAGQREQRAVPLSPGKEDGIPEPSATCLETESWKLASSMCI